MPQATISLELSSTGLRVASREESALRTDVVVVIVFIKMSRA
jgi:diacylglycerol kinase